MAPRRDDNVKSIARRLRVHDKRSVRDIADILGVSHQTVFRWAKEENWPSPEIEKTELKKEIRETEKQVKTDVKAAAADKLPPGPPPEEAAPRISRVRAKKAETSGTAAPDVGDFEIDATTDKAEEMAEKIWRWAIAVVHHSLKFDFNLPHVLKLAERVEKVMLALKAPDPGQIQTFQVFVPPQGGESYRGDADGE